MRFPKPNFKNGLRIAIHLLIWSIVWWGIRYFVIPTLTKDNIGVVKNASIVVYIWDIVVFYFLGYVVFPRFLNTRLFFWLVPIGILLFEITYIIDWYHFKYLFSISDASKKDVQMYIGNAWLDFYSQAGPVGWLGNTPLTFLTYSWSLFYVTPLLGVKTIKDIIKSREQNYLLEREKLMLESNNLALKTERLALQTDLLMMEVSFLHAQVNPHFLFNKLNGIYNKAIDVNDGVAHSIAGLAELMRYSLSVSSQSFVFIEGEINYIKTYIELEKERFGDEVRVTYWFNIDSNQFKIAPLILIAFIENSFKHVVVSDDSFVSISIQVQSGQLTMIVENSAKCLIKENNERTDAAQYTGGIGLQNVQKRLELLYGKNYQWYQKCQNSTFSTELVLQELK